MQLNPTWRLAAWTLPLLAALSACSPKPEDAPPPPPAPAPAVEPAPAPAAEPASAPVGETATDAVEPADPASASESTDAASALAPADFSHFTANGFSPAWQAEVEGEQMRFKVPEIDGPDVQPVAAPAQRSVDGELLRYSGEHAGTPFKLELRAGPCVKATEAGQPREFHAALDYGQSHYEGCADAPR